MSAGRCAPHNLANMPEELAIIIIVLIVVLWLLFKIFVAIGNFITEIQKGFTEAATRREKERFAKGKNKLSRNIRVLLPNQLDEAEKKAASAELEFERFQKTNTRTAEHPVWSKLDFKQFRLPSRSESYSEMDVRTFNLFSRLIPTFGLRRKLGSLLSAVIIHRDRPRAPASVSKPFPR